MAGLAWQGRITDIAPIAGADQIVSATVVCGAGGKWRGVVRKDDLGEGDTATVFLPDTLLPKDDPRFSFMDRHRYRVKPCRLRGAPSEVLIMPALVDKEIGTDVSHLLHVMKYEKPLPPQLNGMVKGNFPTWLPKTDEVHYQKAPALLDALREGRVVITEKLDGSSCSVYHQDGVFGVCSRNYDLAESADNAFWKTAVALGLHNTLPEGMAVQGELVGPKVQGNPLGLMQHELRIFDVFVFGTGYISHGPARTFVEDQLAAPLVKVVSYDVPLPDGDDALLALAEGRYANGRPREGVVVRPLTERRLGHDRVSVKILNLNYKER